MAIKDSRPAPQASKKKKRTLKRQKVVEAGVEDFIPWIPPISRRSPDLEEEEGEDDMSGLIHDFTTQKQKRDAMRGQTTGTSPEVARGSSWSGSDEGSKVQAIVISGLPEMGLNDQSAPENVTLVESREASLVLAAIQVIHPPE